jgi:RNA polymerase sigma factor (sigma-70 family)
VGSDDLYLLHRSAIEQAIRAVCRRQHLLPVDAEDFASVVRLHLIDRDFAVLRQFEGRSSIGTYLLTVITHLGQDWRNARWGRWRPSAEARRQGPLGMQLERLMHRDGLTFDEACETLRTNFRVAESRAALEAMASAFPARSGRRFVPDDQLAETAAAGPGPDDLFDLGEAAKGAGDVVAMLTTVIAALPAQDALILKLRFKDGLRLAEVARALHLDEKQLYRRVPRLLAQLRTELESRGLTAASAGAVMERLGLGEIFEPGAEIAQGGPSLEQGAFTRD